MLDKTLVLDSLVEFNLSGDKNALEKFIELTTDLAFRSAYYITRNKDDAEDVVQSVYYQLIEGKVNCNLKSSSEEKVCSWFVSIVFNTAKKFIRTIVRSREMAKKNIELKANDRSSLNEDSKLNKIELVFDQLDLLPEKYRIPILMKYKEGFSLSEISSILSLNQGTLRSRLSRGLSKLRLNLSGVGVILTIATLSDLIISSPLQAAPISLVNKLKDADNIRDIDRLIPPKAILGSSKVLFILSMTLFLVISFVVLSFLNKAAAVGENPVLSTVKKVKLSWDFSKDEGEDLFYLKGEKIIKKGFLKTNFEKETIFILPNTIGANHKIVMQGRLIVKKGNGSTKYGLFPILFHNNKFVQILKEDNPIENQKNKNDWIKLNKQFFAKNYTVVVYILKQKMLVKFSHNKFSRVIYYKNGFKNKNQIGFCLRNIHISTLKIKPLTPKDFSKVKVLASAGVP